MREIRPLSSESGDWKQGYSEDLGTGIAKAAGNSYRLPLPGQLPTLQGGRILEAACSRWRLWRSKATKIVRFLLESDVGFG